MKKLTTTLLIVGLFTASAYGYGPRGHGLVGAVADRRLAKSNNNTVKTNLKQLLEGLTLQRAATLPDSIKSLDRDPKGFKLTGHPKIEAQLRAFVKANPATGSPSHHEFHFTDVPVAGNEKYADGQVGRSQFDIVHLIPFCIRVLKGEEPQNNNRKITKAVAVILLAHYLGDIHQPLHVGAEYFASDGTPLEPSASNLGFADQGGNKLTLSLLIKGKKVSFPKLHAYWDGDTVNSAFGTTADATVAQQLASKEPADWKLSGGVETWAEALANEILPIAREAHARLDFKKIKFKAGSKDIISGDAVEKKTTSGSSYERWAGAAVKDEIQKAGWRLAALLEEVLQ